MVWGLRAGLLMLAALVAVVGVGSAKVFPGTVSPQPAQSIIAAPHEQAAAVHEAVSADRDIERPCGRNGTVPGTARCPTVQCITVCGGLPAATFAIPDLPPPRPSA